MPSRAATVCLSAALLALAACGGYQRPEQAASQLSFGVDMARRGLWDEALFRFAEAEKLDPENPRIASNIGVAYEASGQFEKAKSYYQKALKLAPNDKEIRANYGRFIEFYQGFTGEKTKGGLPKTTTTTHKAPAVPAPPPVDPGIPEPSTPGDTPPPPADSRPPL
jgi:tetratricopeptide (TPR) repeat protein